MTQGKLQYMRHIMLLLTAKLYYSNGGHGPKDGSQALLVLLLLLQELIVILLLLVSLGVVGLGDGLAGNLHALLEAVGNGALAGGGVLGKGGGAAKGAGAGAVADADDADVLGVADGALAGHAGGHLDLQGEVGVGGEGEALEAEAGDVLDDVGLLEGAGVLAARGAVDVGRQGAGAVLVDLAVDHADDAVAVRGGQALRAAHAGRVGDHALGLEVALGAAGAAGTAQEAAQATGSTALLGSAASTTSGTSGTTGGTTGGATGTAEEAAKELAELALALLVALGRTGGEAGEVVLLADGARGTVVLGRGLAGAHEAGNVDGGVDGAGALGLAEGALLHVAVADDGGVGLRAAAVGGAVTRSTISDWWNVLAGFS